MTGQQHEKNEIAMAARHLEITISESCMIDTRRHPYYRAARAHESLGRNADVRGGICYLNGRPVNAVKFMAMVGMGLE